MSTLRDTEIAVLYAAIVSPTARAEAKRHITGRDFEDPRHEAIWDAMIRLEHHGKDVGWITVNHVLAGNEPALRVVPEVVASPSIPDQVGNYADIVRDKAMLRRLRSERDRLSSLVDREDVSGNGLAASLATRFAALRDSGMAHDDVAALTLDEIMATPETPYDWIIPNLLERSDRLMLTGEEGLGKSHLLRQIAVFTAAGLHPFRAERIEPVKTTIIDCENTLRQVRRSVGPVLRAAERVGDKPGSRVVVECIGRLDLTADRELAKIHHLLDATLPDVVVIGPLYRLIPRAITNDDDAAPLLAALDTIRNRGIALLIEAHAGHAIGKAGVRDLRPRGSSALLGWPEFGYGMRHIDEFSCELVPWRGDRDERHWPEVLMRDPASHRWLPRAA